MKKYIFKNLIINGEKIERVEVKEDNYEKALNNLTLFILHKFNIPMTLFSRERKNISDNIEKGFFDVIVTKEPIQGELNFETHGFRTENDLIWESYINK